MALPQFEEVIIPMLNHIAENTRYDKLKGSRFIARFFNLSKEEKEFEPAWRYNPHNFRRPMIDLSNLVLDYLNDKGLIWGNTTERKITKEGQLFLNKNITLKDIEALPFKSNNPESYIRHYKEERDEMKAFIDAVNSAILRKTDKLVDKKVNGKSVSQMLEELLLNCDPYEFEHIITKVLADIYKGEGKVTQASKDNGIDSIINVKHPITPQVILVQVKKYSNGSIPLDFVKAFITSVEKSKFKATAGIFFASCDFSKPARQFVEENAHQIKLLTLKELVKIMIESKIGVQSYKRANEDIILIPDEKYFGRKISGTNLLQHILDLSNDDN